MSTASIVSLGHPRQLPQIVPSTLVKFVETNLLPECILL
jgi:hypothetical protein